MAQRTQVVGELKRLLKERDLTYVQVAKTLKLSVASVKRLFSSGDFSLQRVDEICDLCGIDMTELLERARDRALPTIKLTVAQEREVVADPKLFLVAWLVMNRYRFDDIVKTYQLTERELQRYLIKLDRLRVIELQPLNKVRLLVSRHFSWRPDGPVQSFIQQKVLREFMADKFIDPRDAFIFHGGSVSEGVLTQLKRVLQHAARECSEVMENDHSPPTARNGAAFVLAMRSWDYTGFTDFLRA